MSRYIFLFDMDTAVTRQEILPTIAKRMDLLENKNSWTENTMRGEVPFQQSFIQKANLLKTVPVSHMRRMVAEIPLNERVVEFIKAYQDRCYIITANLDVWIEEVVRAIGMEKHLFCSKAHVRNDYVQDIYDVVNKNSVVTQMSFPCVAIGSGNHDAEMIEVADIGIGYGGKSPISSSVLACASHVVYQEAKLVEFLERLV